MYNNLCNTEKIDFWRNHYTRWKNSGITQIEYCKLNKLKKSTMSLWFSRVKETSINNTTAYSNLTELNFDLTDISKPSEINIIISNKLKIAVNEDFNPQLLRKVLKTIRVEL